MQTDKPLILLVDDDPGLRDLLKDYLGANGYEVAEAGDGAAMKQVLTERQPDLVLMDLMLPGEDGLSLTRWIRSQGDLPIIMLSARGEEVDRVVGLEVGADDYLPKPFSPRELLARIRAVVRRRAGAAREPAAAADGYVFGPYRLDPVSGYDWRPSPAAASACGVFRRRFAFPKGDT